ncbi:hypothetical protein OG963_43735 (plasmid) [Streptomyces sp. NBC_01707]|uniref:hypothetical protein n=1 Tax=Streptomyces sp. NBC_01707 TaxID=2975914 RepID=UPI002F9111CA
MSSAVGPADLLTFYDGIVEVTWAGIGNGYFLDRASDVFLRLQAQALPARPRRWQWARTSAASSASWALMDRFIGGTASRDAWEHDKVAQLNERSSMFINDGAYVLSKPQTNWKYGHILRLFRSWARRVIKENE